MTGKLIQLAHPPNPSGGLGGREMQATVPIGDVSFDLLAGMPAYQCNAFGASGDRAVRSNGRFDPCVCVPAELERATDHLDAYQTRVRTGALLCLKPRACAAILAIDRFWGNWWRRGRWGRWGRSAGREPGTDGHNK